MKHEQYSAFNYLKLQCQQTEFLLLLEMKIAYFGKVRSTKFKFQLENFASPTIFARSGMKVLKY
jgi:hypothetical protein